MKASEMRDLQIQDLREEIEKSREKLFKMRFQAKGKDIENPGEMKNLRRTIARLLTVLRQRESAGS